MAIVEIVQLLLATLLLFVLFFGIGFILNMLMKTTWFPIYGYLILIVGLLIYWSWGEGSLFENLAKYTWYDYVVGIGGLLGAALSGVTIRLLRLKGFKMF